MNDEINYKNNPLHGLGLKNMLIEIVDHYGFEILFAYLNINCFKTNPSIESSVKFLKKTDWAREKVEAFYLYKYKNLPKVSSEQFSTPPRDRIIPDGQTPREPAELSMEDAEQLREKQAKKVAAYGEKPKSRRHPNSNFTAQKEGHSNNRDRSKTQENSRKSPRKLSSTNANSSNPWGNWGK
jgi:uncharacterized protein (DUF2132 family)